MAREPPPDEAMTTPSYSWMRSLSPSLILVWTRTVSPARKSGTSLRRYLASTAAISLRSIVSSPLQLVVAGLDEPAVVFVQLQAREQVRAPFPRGPERLAPAPPLHAPVIPGEEDLWDLLSAKRRRPCVVRVLQDGGSGEALPAGRGVVSEHPRDQAGSGLHHAERRQPATGEHEIPAGDLHVDCRPHALVHSLVAPAGDDDPSVLRQFLHQPLGERHAPGAHEQHPGPGQPLAGGLDGGGDRLRLHHHPSAPTVGSVVGDPVLPGGVLADVGHPRVEEPRLPRLPENALGEVALAHPREEGQDLHLQPLHVRLLSVLRASSSSSSSSPGGASPSPRPSSRSTVTQGASGTSRSPPGPRTTSTSTPPVTKSSTTRPSSAPLASTTGIPSRSAQKWRPSPASPISSRRPQTSLPRSPSAAFRLSTPSRRSHQIRPCGPAERTLRSPSACPALRSATLLIRESAPSVPATPTLPSRPTARTTVPSRTQAISRGCRRRPAGPRAGPPRRPPCGWPWRACRHGRSPGPGRTGRRPAPGPPCARGR